MISESLLEISDNNEDFTNVVLLNAHCLVLSISLGGLANLSKKFKMKIYNNVIKYNDMEIIISRAVRKAMPICFSLKSKKIYVGFIDSTIDPGEKRSDVRILPLLSGYREKDTNEIVFTTNYYQVYESNSERLEHLSENDFEIAFPFSEVQSVNLFDISAYNLFTENASENQLEFIF